MVILMHLHDGKIDGSWYRPARADTGIPYALYMRNADVPNGSHGL